MTVSIILVRPQMGENIGAAARAMANFGLGDLRLVAPRDGWPNVKASDTAGKAINLIDDAAVFADVQAAVADCQFVVATTARARAMSLPVMDVRDAMAELHARAARGEKCAVLFGPERTGLENEDMALADAVVTIPVAPEYASLNVGQAVVVACYEWWMAVSSLQASVVSEEVICERAAGAPLPAGEVTRLASQQLSSAKLGEGAEKLSRSGEGAYPLGAIPENKDTLQNRETSLAAARPHPDFLSAGALGNPTSPAGRGAPAAPLATREHLLGLLGQLEVALDDVNFWRVPEKKDVMWRNIRTTLVRAGMSEQEIATWRGLVKALVATGEQQKK